MKLNLKNMTLSVDFERGRIDSLLMLDRERLGGKMPLFKIIIIFTHLPDIILYY